MTVTIIRTDLIKGALISYLKTVDTVTNKLDDYGSGAVEIREIQWKSDDFAYPAVRFRMIRNAPDNGDCTKSEISFSWVVLTEDQSSATCDEISGIIAAYFQTRQFSVAFQGNTYHFSCGGVSIIPATGVGVSVWRSEVVVEGFVSRT